MKLDNYIEYIKEKHKGQTRKQGTPYYMHPLEVSNILHKKGFFFFFLIAGLFHDLLEDTNATYEELVEISNKEIANSVKLVTKEKDYVMSEYIDRIMKNDMARMVKLADRVHNLSETHLASEKFKEKYVKETEKWFINLAAGTVFEEDIKDKLDNLKQEIQNKREIDTNSDSLER